MTTELQAQISLARTKSARTALWYFVCLMVGAFCGSCEARQWHDLLARDRCEAAFQSWLDNGTAK